MSTTYFKCLTQMYLATQIIEIQLHTKMKKQENILKLHTFSIKEFFSCLMLYTTGQDNIFEVWHILMACQK